MCLQRNLVDIFKSNTGDIRNYYSVNNVVDVSKDKSINKYSYFSGIIKRDDAPYYNIDYKKLKDLCFKERVGYKVYREYGNGELHAFQGYWLRNKWYESNLALVKDDSDQQYITGFHILWSREDARKYKKSLLWSNIGIYKVLYNDIIHLGLDKGLQVAIARKMKILNKI